MKYLKLLTLVLALAILSCSQPKGKNIVISGISKELVGDTVYLKEYDHFNYLNDNFIIDSSIVQNDGSFSFKLNYDSPRLVTVSSYNNPPPSYNVFQQNPEMYFYSFCANFFAMSPTIYIESEKNYDITSWDEKNENNSIQFNDEKQNKLRQYYRTVDYRAELADENREIQTMEPALAWGIIQNKQNEFLEEFGLNNEFPLLSYENYLKTEIILGAVNDFLIWNNLQAEYSISPELYDDILNTYNQDNWSPNSVEYFKLTERYVTYQLNLKNNKQENYYPPDETKLQVAQEYAKQNIRDKYTNNIKKLIKAK